MANVIIDDAYLVQIANAIRTKLNTWSPYTTYTPQQMGTAIYNISSGTVVEELYDFTMEDC